MSRERYELEMLARNCEACNARGAYETIYEVCVPSPSNFFVSTGPADSELPAFNKRYLCLSCKEKENEY